MSRDSDKEQFRQLRRLLALKRHEQPPPGFYHGFSSQVIARIRAGETGAPDTIFHRLLVQAPWLERWWGAFANRPSLAGAFGAGVCALLVSLVVYSENSEPASLNSVLASQGGFGTATAASIPTTDPLEHGSISSTNAIPLPGGSLFDRFDLNVQPAGLTLPAN